MTISMAMTIINRILAKLEDSTVKPQSASIVIYGATGARAFKIVRDVLVSGDVNYTNPLLFYDWNSVIEQVGRITSIEVVLSGGISIEFDDFKYRIDNNGIFEIHQYVQNWRYNNSNDITEVIDMAISVIG